MSLVAAEQDPGHLRHQFDAEGHVYVPGVYDPLIGPFLGEEVDSLFRAVSSYAQVLGSQKRGLENPTTNYRSFPNLNVVLGAIGRVSIDKIGLPLWPATPGSHTLIDSIDMSPLSASTSKSGPGEITPVEGNWHTDRADIQNIVAITTYAGESVVEFKDKNAHVLKPGGVAFINPRLMHRGVALVPRRALIISRVANNP